MDNMLYIIAGLVIVLLIAVLIMRRQKAQPPISRNISDASTTKTSPSLTTNDFASTSSTAATKFDDLTIAERFIDQQRYDKAIEVLERGLIQKPNDASLSLKLLNLYAITNQTDSFYNTYNTISTRGDSATLAQANELKSLLDQELDQNTQTLTQSDTLEPKDTLSANAEGYEALDFELSDSPTTSQNLAQADVFSPEQQQTDSNDLSAFSLAADPFTDKSLDNESTLDNSFDLTLDDLESEPLESEADDFDIFATEGFDTDDNNQSFELDSSLNSSAQNSPDSLSLDSDEALALDNESNKDTLALDETTLSFKPDESFKDVDTTSDDFNFDFDESAATAPLTTETAANIEQPNTQGSSDFEDDFVLDFDDLAADSHFDTDIVADTDTGTIDNDADNFIEAKADTNNFDDTETVANNLNPDIARADDSSSYDFELDLEDEPSQALQQNINTTDGSPTNHDVEIATDSSSYDFELNLEDEQTQTTGQSKSDELLFDDNTPLNEGFVLTDEGLDESAIEDSATITTPTLPEGIEPDSTETENDFTAQFAADFDFVNELDNNQVTLDLATKYLELGEYDSAKRLLNEVLSQGNSEQQTQAQSLLQRTA